MSRPAKQTVDFFPHHCKHGKTIFILEQRYGNNGYAFWFKLLEQLGNHSGHYLNLNDEAELEFLGAETRVSGAETIEILNLLGKLGAIDSKLWEKRIVWCQHFVDNLTEVYNKRVVSVPVKPVSGVGNEVSGVGNPQSRVEESKLLLSSTDDGKCLIQINEATMIYEELEYIPLQEQSQRKGLGRKTMFVLARAYLDVKEIILEKGQTFDANKISKGLSKLYREANKDPHETIRRIKLGADYFNSKNLDWTLETIWRHWEDIAKWEKDGRPTEKIKPLKTNDPRYE